MLHRRGAGLAARADLREPAENRTFAAIALIITEKPGLAKPDRVAGLLEVHLGYARTVRLCHLRRSEHIVAVVCLAQAKACGLCFACYSNISKEPLQPVNALHAARIWDVHCFSSKPAGSSS